ncbi:MAG: phage tail tube protein [Gammaproteobacteria bacterium]|nr:phage tail tube protein [Gammaproteobacteria bacterium]
MPIKYRKKVLLAKIEAVAGTAEALAAADAVLASNIEITPLAGDTVNRELERPYYGRNADIPVNVHATLAFRVELAGSGDADTAPAWGRLLRACGFAEVVTANTRVDYTPVSAAESTITLGLNIDGQLFTLHGARGTFSLEAGANQIPYLNFTFTGRYNAPGSVAQVANPDYTPYKLPLVGSSANTPTFELFGNRDLALSAYSYEHANEVTHRELIGADSEVIITNRAPSFSVTIDAPTFATLNLVEKAKNADTGALKIVHGAAAGKIIEITAPKVQAAGPSVSEADGAMQMQVTLAALPNAAAGNDEIKITTK